MTIGGHRRHPRGPISGLLAALLLSLIAARAPALAGPPLEPSVAEIEGSLGKPGGELNMLAGSSLRYPPARRLRLRPPGRLRP